MVYTDIDPNLPFKILQCGLIYHTCMLWVLNLFATCFSACATTGNHTLGACTRLKLNVNVIRMGRPAGTVETKLSNEEVNQIVASVDCAKVNDVIMTRGLLDMANIFDKAADKAPGRVQLEKNEYIIRPLLEASPVHTIHIDSFLASSFMVHEPC